MTAILHLTADLPCDPAAACQRFLDPAQLTDWLCAAAQVEPAVGGKYELFWDAEDRSDLNTAGCRITALVPGELLAFDWRGPNELAAMEAWDPRTHVVVSFLPTPAGTRVHLVHTGWPATEPGEAARAWFQRAWSLAFATLPQAETT